MLSVYCCFQYRYGRGSLTCERGAQYSGQNNVTSQLTIFVNFCISNFTVLSISEIILFLVFLL